MHGQEDLLDRVGHVAIGHAEAPKAAEDEVRVLLVNAFEGHAWGVCRILFLLRGTTEAGSSPKVCHAHQAFTENPRSTTVAARLDS